MPPVTKFTYLRELLDGRVHKTINALQHTAKGYNRAVATLKEQFGKESKIVKTYMKEILDLHYTPTANPKGSFNSTISSPTAYNPSKY